MQRSLILASASPRRKQLLSQLGAKFEIRSADIDESVLANESPQAYVSRLALQKCEAVFKQLSKDAVVIGSDTTVVIDQKILGKPENEQEAVDMLMLLSGRWHHVMTAVAIKDGKNTRQIVVTADVEFCHIDETMARQYWLTKEPADKAGSYGIQGIGARFVKQIKGSYSAIVGFPVAQVADLLDDFEVPYWRF